MKLSNQFKTFLGYVLLILVFSFLCFGCGTSKAFKLSKRKKTQDEIQLEFFKTEIKYRTHYLTKI